MRAPRVGSLSALAALLLAAGCGAGGEGEEAPAAAGGFDAERALGLVREQVKIGPRPAGSPANARLTRTLAVELERAGAEDVEVQGPLRNVVGTIPGEDEGWIVVGAHHDTKDIPGFVGANDGASGVAVVVELARALPKPAPGPSIAIALFDGEEARGNRSFERDGRRGSRRYVRIAAAGGGRGVPPLEQIRAMVLFDLVGDCELRIPREGFSDPALYALFAEAAPEAFTGRTGAIDDDHVSFREAGVPAVDVIDFSYGPGGSPGAFWHTREDTLDKVCAASLGAVGEAALEAIPRIR